MNTGERDFVEGQCKFFATGKRFDTTVSKREREQGGSEGTDERETGEAGLRSGKLGKGEKNPRSGRTIQARSRRARQHTQCSEEEFGGAYCY